MIQLVHLCKNSVIVLKLYFLPLKLSHVIFNLLLWLLVSGFENSNEMSRSISWRRVCPDFVNTRIEEAYEKVVYIVHQTGPTGFVLKQEGEEKKFKV